MGAGKLNRKYSDIFVAGTAVQPQGDPLCRSETLTAFRITQRLFIAHGRIKAKKNLLKDLSDPLRLQTIRFALRILVQLVPLHWLSERSPNHFR